MKLCEARLLNVLLAAAFIGGGLSGYSGGPPVRRTGAPGDLTCLDAGCHIGDRLLDSPAVRLETSGSLTYTHGGPRQRWVLRVHDNGARAYGFQLSARLALDPSRSPGGGFHETSANIQVICQNDRPAGAAGCQPDSLPQFVQHSMPQEAGEFAFDWTPPAEDKGDILIYIAANASIAGQRNSRIHFNTFRVRPAVTSGVVDAASSRSSLSQGSWATIFAATGSAVARAWQNSDLRDGNLPLALESVAVRVNGRPTAISYVSPAQVNFLAPTDIAAGHAIVELFQGRASVNLFEAKTAPINPALFGYHDGGRYFAAASDAKGEIINPSNPARPGETILVYASGMGATLPLPPTGAVFVGAFPVVAPTRLRIGGQDARITFAGLVAPGLYQVNAIVPDLSPSYHAVSLEAAGRHSQDGILLPVGVGGTRMSSPFTQVVSQ